MIDILDWVDDIEKYACGDISGEVLDLVTGELFDAWAAPTLWTVIGSLSQRMVKGTT